MDKVRAALAVPAIVVGVIGLGLVIVPAMDRQHAAAVQWQHDHPGKGILDGK